MNNETTRLTKQPCDSGNHSQPFLSLGRKGFVVALAVSLSVVTLGSMIELLSRNHESISAADAVKGGEASDFNLEKAINLDVLEKKKQKCYEDTECFNEKMYSAKTMKTAFETPLAALFKDSKNEKKFEASGLEMVGDTFYAVCDNSWAISKFGPSLTTFGDDNVLIGDPRREEDDSNYEAIFHYNNTFYVLRESIKHSHEKKKKYSYHAIIEELSLGEDDYEILDQCRSEMEFEGMSKGFEGAVGFPGTDGSFYILALCEGNHCSEKKKKKFDKGHGRIIMMKKEMTPEGCLWKTVKTIKIPADANFKDYSDIDVTPSGKIAITTQEDSALYIGQLVGLLDGTLDPDTIDFNTTVKGDTYQFPKTNVCQTQYCNIEGIAFINDTMLMATSDKMKGKGKQPYWCFEKDQSVHAFVTP